MERTPTQNGINNPILITQQHNIKHVTCGEVKLQVVPDNLSSIISI